MNKRENNYRMMTILALTKFILPAVLIAGFILSAVFGEKELPLDNCVGPQQEVIKHLSVVDSMHEGFRVVYVTKNGVCPQRLEEIMSRKSIRDGFERVRLEVPLCFNNDMLDTDIYDFAEVVLQYEVDPDLKIHNIFVEGTEKCAMYARLNPNIDNYASWIDPNTEQGVQYLKSDDVYHRRKKEDRIYRYWKCGGYNKIPAANDFSTTDERFSHFSEGQRIR